MSGWKRLIEEAHRRSIWHVVGIYAAGSWVAFEVISGLVDAVGLPSWFPAAAIVLFLIGLPIVLATAFIQHGAPAPPSATEWDPTLLPEEHESLPVAPRPAPAAAHRLFTWRNALGGGIAAFALWGMMAAGWMLFAGAAPGDPQPPRLVVLPFENLGAAQDEYFADGITEELTSRLAESPALQVISRTTALQYKGAGMNLGAIGRELAVDYVLEGTIRWEHSANGPSRIRVTPQLIRVSDDTHLWTERYDAVLADVFRVQEQIARQVTVALAGVLGDTTVVLPDAAPRTENLEAYDFYLRAHEYFYRRFDRGEVHTAAELYGRAVDLDPTFAAAWSRLVRARVWLKHNFGEYDQLAPAREALASLERVAPGSVEARMGRGFYEYYGQRDYAAALREFEALLPSRPNDVDVISAVAFLNRRLGRWEEAVSGMRRAFDLDPRSSPTAYTLAQTLLDMRRPDEAEPFVQRAIALEPELASYSNLLIAIHATGRGDTARAWAVLDAQEERLGRPLPGWRDARHFLRREYEAVAAPLLADSSLTPWGHYRLGYTLDLLDRETEAREHWEAAVRMVVEDLAGIDTTGTAAMSRVALLRSTAAVALASLGREEEALAWGERARRTMDADADALVGDNVEFDLALMYLELGDAEAALDQLERLLSMPGFVTVHRLRLDPAFDDLRDHPRFQGLIAEQRLRG